MEKDFVFTTGNLLENIHKMGAWSSYGMATEALAYYFPKLYNSETGECPETLQEIELMQSLGCQYWEDIIIKFHKEVGYKTDDGTFNVEAVNEN